MSEKAATSKVRRLALDNLPFWNQQQVDEFRQTKKSPLPEGVTNKGIYKDILTIAWPSMIELALTQLASMVDLMMVGKIHYSAVTAVGLTTQPKFILMMLIQSLCVGTTAMVARFKGAQQPERANLIMRQSLMMTLMISVVLAFLGYIFSDPLLRFVGATDETIKDAGDYLRIQMIGFVPLALTFVCTAALRGAGDSRTAMIYNTIANVVNVFFNWVLIYGHLGAPALGIIGASLATIIGQFTAFVIAMYKVMHKSEKQYLHLRLKDGFKPDKNAIAQIFSIGIPSMGEQLVMRVGMIIFGRLVVSTGSLFYATHTVCMNIMSMSFMLGQAIAVSSTSLVGQSLGKNRPDMAKHYSMRASTVGIACSIVLALVFIFFGKQLVGLYNDDPTVISTGARIMFFVAFLQPFQCGQFVLAGSLRGAGDTRATAIITLITVLGIRTGMGFVFIKLLNMGLYGAWYAIALDQMIRTILVVIRYMQGNWMFLKIRNA